MTGYEEDFDFCEPDERRFSPRLSLLIIVLLSGVAWWLLLPVLSFLFSFLGPYAIIAIVLYGLIRLGRPLFEKSVEGMILGDYYPTD